MLNEHFILLGSIITFMGLLTYLRDTIKGNVQPNKVSWLFWAIAPLIAFAAQVQQGVGYHALLAFTLGFGPLLVFAASFINKKAYWKIERFDLFCGAFSLLALILWYTTGVGNIAIMFSIIADVTASLPTIIKAYKEPETESSPAFFAASIGGMITLLTIHAWNFETYGFPLYIFIMMGLIALLIQFKLGKKIHFVK